MQSVQQTTLRQLKTPQGNRNSLNQLDLSLDQGQPPARRSTLQCIMKTFVSILLVIIGVWTMLRIMTQPQPVILTYDDLKPSIAQPLSHSIKKTVWKYCTTVNDQTKLHELSTRLNQRFLSNSDFQVTIVNDTNFKDYLNTSTAAELTSSLQQFEQFVKKSHGDEIPQSLLLQRWRAMEIRVKTLHILEANGGVMMDSDLTLTQSLDWIYEIDTNPFTNRLNNWWPTSVIGFMDPRESSKLVEYATNDPVSAPFKQVRERPALSPMFIVTFKNAEFISKLCLEFRKALRQGQNLLKNLTSANYHVSNSQQFLSLSRIVLEELSQSQERSPGKATLLVDTIGLSLINIFYGPDKLKRQLMQYRDPATVFNFYADFPFERLQELFGSFRYSLSLGHYSELFEVMSGKRKVLQKSLMHYLLPHLNSSNLYSDSEVSNTNQNAPLWKNLPKKVWAVWMSGYDDSYIICKVTYAIIKQRFQSRGYQVNLVTLKNARNFISDKMMTKLQRVHQNPEYQQYRYGPTMADLMRVALLVEHGGVYLDMATLVLDDVDWIENIARMPTHLLVNRFSELPKVLTSHNFFMPYPPFWKINPETHTKESLIANYQNYFIIAEKGNQYIKLVLSRYMQMLESPWSKIGSYLENLGLIGNTLILEGSYYLLEMQMMQAVLLQKQQQLDSSNNTQWLNAAHYYGVWSIFSPYGPTKYWRHYNHLEDDERGVNPYFMSYSTDYAYELLGQPRFPIVKLLGDQTRSFTKFLDAVPQDIRRMTQAMHPNSDLRKVMDAAGLDIVRKGRWPWQKRRQFKANYQLLEVPN